jgi:hypothetical protein
MKKVLILLAIVAALVAGYLLFVRDSSSTTEPLYTNKNSAKINIDVVCEAALAYMSFPDGESADKFVAECKEGKHPRVIEDYKAQMNLSEGAAI